MNKMNSNRNKTYRLGGRHLSNTKNLIEYEKVNPRSKKLVKIIKRTCSICEGNKSQIFTEQMTRGESLKVLNALMVIDHLCQKQHGVI